MRTLIYERRLNFIKYWVFTKYVLSTKWKNATKWVFEESRILEILTDLWSNLDCSLSRFWQFNEEMPLNEFLKDFACWVYFLIFDRILVVNLLSFVNLIEECHLMSSWRLLHTCYVSSFVHLMDKFHLMLFWKVLYPEYSF